MNVYDFDKTIYQGDSSLDFYFFCIRRHPSLLRYLPRQMVLALQYALRQVDKTTFKQGFFTFLRGLKETDKVVSSFWKLYHHKIAPWYLNQLQSDDLIISASPEFLLSYPCKTLGIAAPIASQISISDGSFIGNNCKGAEKVMRFHQNYGDTPIDCFYSDSLSDTPLAALANQAFLVTKSGMRPWP